MKGPEPEAFQEEVERLRRAGVKPALVFRYSFDEFVQMSALMGSDWRDNLFMHAVESTTATIEGGDNYLSREYPRKEGSA